MWNDSFYRNLRTSHHQLSLLKPFGRISDSPMLCLLDMLLILSSLFLNLIHHVHSQIHYQNQVTNVQWAYLTKIGSNYSSYYISTFVRLNILVWTKMGCYWIWYRQNYSGMNLKKMNITKYIIRNRCPSWYDELMISLSTAFPYM